MEELRGREEEGGTIDQPVEVEGGQDNDYNPKESVRETVIKAVQENEAKGEGNGSEGIDSISDPKDSAHQENERPLKKEPKLPEDSFDPDLTPPARFESRAKQVFNNLPKTIRREVSRMVREHEAQLTKVHQEIAPARREYQDIDRLIQPHLAEWTQHGHTKTTGVAELIGTHEKLKDPRTKEQTLRWLAHNTNQSHLLRDQDETGPNAPQANIENHPVVQQLRNELLTLQNNVSPVVSGYQQSIAQRDQAEVNTAIQEVTAVQNERTASGQWVRPRLQDRAFLGRIEPLVVETVRSIPELGYGNALKKVHDMFESPVGAPGRTSNGSYPPSFNAGNQYQPTRAYTADVSARGRSALPAGAMSQNGDIPDGARGSVRDTVAWVLNNRGRG